MVSPLCQTLTSHPDQGCAHPLATMARSVTRISVAHRPEGLFRIFRYLWGEREIGSYICREQNIKKEESKAETDLKKTTEHLFTFRNWWWMRPANVWKCLLNSVNPKTVGCFLFFIWKMKLWNLAWFTVQCATVGMWQYFLSFKIQKFHFPDNLTCGFAWNALCIVNKFFINELGWKISI